MLTTNIRVTQDHYNLVPGRPIQIGAAVGSLVKRLIGWIFSLVNVREIWYKMAERVAQQMARLQLEVQKFASATTYQNSRYEGFVISGISAKMVWYRQGSFLA